MCIIIIIQFIQNQLDQENVRKGVQHIKNLIVCYAYSIHSIQIQFIQSNSFMLLLLNVAFI